MDIQNRGALGAEFFGTMIYTLIGMVGESVYYLSHTTPSREFLHDYTPFLVWGLGLTAAYFVSGGISGGQFNATVTIAYCAVGEQSWKMLYLIPGQIAGALIGTLICRGFFHDEVDESSVNVWLALRKNDFTFADTTFSIFLGSLLFMLIKSAICDKKNMRIPPAAAAVFIGLTDATLILIIFSYCWMSTVPINPSIDIANSCIYAFFTRGDVQFGRQFIYYLISILGGVCGIFIYMFFVRTQWDLEPLKAPAPVTRITHSVQNVHIEQIVEVPLSTPVYLPYGRRSYSFSEE